MFALVAISSVYLPPSLGVAGLGSALMFLPIFPVRVGWKPYSIAGGAMIHVPAWAGLEEVTYSNSQIFPNRLSGQE